MHATVSVASVTWMTLAALSALGYGLLAWRVHRRGGLWRGWRTLSFASGAALVALAAAPALLPWSHGDFRQHMLQHLIIGMLAPLALVLGAPITLLLRTLPAHGRRRLVQLLRLRYLRVVSHPVVALCLNIGGMGVLYFTPVYGVMAASNALHQLVHVHFLLAGCLFSWVIAGPDPAPARPSVPYRLVVLGIAVTVHAAFSQLLYAGLFIAVELPHVERQTAAALMYYGGDIAELLLALALVSGWRPRQRRASRHCSPGRLAFRGSGR